MNKLVRTAIAAAVYAVSAFAAPWAVTANIADRTINTIDMGTSTPTVYGPFLAGQLGSGDNLLDITMEPDGHHALVSNFNDNMVYRLDLTNPTNPTVVGSVSIGFQAEDIAVSPTGTFAVVTDGYGTSSIAIIALPSLTVTPQTMAAGTQAVDVASDGTVVFANYADDTLTIGTIDSANPAAGVSGMHTVSTSGDSVNVTFSPDEQTLLAASQATNSVDIFQHTAPGTLAATGSIGGFGALGPQSIAFSPDGSKAYVLTAGAGAALSWLQVNGPGSVTLGGMDVASAGGQTESFYGVDQLAVGNGFALASNDTASVANIDLSDWSVTAIPVSSTTAGLTLVTGSVAVPLSDGAKALLAMLFASTAFFMLRRRQTA